MKFALALSLCLVSVAFTSGHADAKPRHLTCTPGVLGCPAVKPATRPTAAVTPSASAASTDPLANILNGILNAKAQVIADLNQALTTQASVINPDTGSAWDPYSVMCLGGVPAVGTAGQPGFVAATPGLIAWIQGLQAPAVASVPPLPANPSAATLAVHARLLLMAANSDVNTVLTQINTSGIPSNLKLACGSLINDTVTQGTNLIGQGAAFAALLAKVVPAAAVIVPKP